MSVWNFKIFNYVMRAIRTYLIASALLAFIPSVIAADCYPDPGTDLENYPVFHFGTEGSAPAEC